MYALIGVALTAIIGWLIGTLLEHPVGPGGLQILGAFLGALAGLAVLMFGEALKEKPPMR